MKNIFKEKELSFLIFLKIRKDSVNKSRAILTFLIGLSVVLVAMLLPAIGRSAFGTTQSLSLRYHSITLAGSLILLSPLIEIFFYNQRKKRILFLYSSLVVSCQLIVGSNFVYFVDQDKLNKTYSAQLLNWQESGKPEHLQPQYPDNLVPGGNPDFVYQNLLWLK